MGLFSRFFTSSIGRKLVMSLTGLFLIIFLVVHLLGNLQLMADDGGRQFNLYAKFMTTNPLIKTISYLLYAGILLHAIQGWILWRKNRIARGSLRYDVKVTRAIGTNAFVAKNMGWLGTIIFIFLLIHLYQFWFQMKIDALPYATYDGVQVKNLYTSVEAAFTNIWFVIFYVVSMVVLGVHLFHGFQSAFQTLGVNHRKFGPLIVFLGAVYSIAIPLGFAIIPILFFLVYT